MVSGYWTMPAYLLNCCHRLEDYNVRLQKPPWCVWGFNANFRWPYQVLTFRKPGRKWKHFLAARKSKNWPLFSFSSAVIHALSTLQPWTSMANSDFPYETNSPPLTVMPSITEAPLCAAIGLASPLILSSLWCSRLVYWPPLLLLLVMMLWIYI